MDPQLFDLKQPPCIISEYLWVRNLGAVYLEILSQGSLWGCRQGVGRGWNHLKPWMGLEDLTLSSVSWLLTRDLTGVFTTWASLAGSWWHDNSLSMERSNGVSVWRFPHTHPLQERSSCIFYFLCLGNGISLPLPYCIGHAGQLLYDVRKNYQEVGGIRAISMLVTTKN